MSEGAERREWRPAESYVWVAVLFLGAAIGWLVLASKRIEAERRRRPEGALAHVLEQRCKDLVAQRDFYIERFSEQLDRGEAIAADLAGAEHRLQTWIAVEVGYEWAETPE